MLNEFLAITRQFQIPILNLPFKMRQMMDRKLFSKVDIYLFTVAHAVAKYKKSLYPEVEN